VQRRTSEATAPERRSFVLLLAGANLLFLAVDASRGAPAALAGRVVVSAALVAGWALLGRPLRPRAVDAVVLGLGVAVAAAFAAITWATGGTESVYFPFLPMIPLVFGIAVPDAPAAAVTVGATAAAPAILRLAADGAPPRTIGFWVLAFATTTAYACASAIFFVRQRAREARLEAERARGEAALVTRSRERARLDRLVLVGRLAAGVSHDLANPLSAARANLSSVDELLAGRGAIDTELREVLDDLGAALERMRRTVEDLRTFSRESAGSREDCAVGEVLGEALRLLAVRLRAGADVVADVAPGLPAVRADRRRLVQAFLWVLVDAAGALREGAPPAGARLCVTARCVDDRVSVAVDAAAVPPNGADEGLRSLAMALAREDLAKDGGALESEVAPGGAVRLVIRLPVASAGAGAPEARASAEPPAR
jgi:signal transduction histidine kinase